MTSQQSEIVSAIPQASTNRERPTATFASTDGQKKTPPHGGAGVIPLRFERRTYCLEGSCSIQLSYGTSTSLSGHPDSNWGSPAPKAGAITGLRYIPQARPLSKKRRLSDVFFLWRRRGDSNPRYPNRVRQFSKLLVSATHPPLRSCAISVKVFTFPLRNRLQSYELFFN